MTWSDRTRRCRDDVAIWPILTIVNVPRRRDVTCLTFDRKIPRGSENQPGTGCLSLADYALPGVMDTFFRLAGGRGWASSSGSLCHRHPVSCPPRATGRPAQATIDGLEPASCSAESLTSDDVEKIEGPRRCDGVDWLRTTALFSTTPPFGVDRLRATTDRGRLRLHLRPSPRRAPAAGANVFRLGLHHPADDVFPSRYWLHRQFLLSSSFGTVVSSSGARGHRLAGPVSCRSLVMGILAMSRSRISRSASDHRGGAVSARRLRLRISSRLA